jgi:hypothetical protein
MQKITYFNRKWKVSRTFIDEIKKTSEVEDFFCIFVG